MQHEGKPITVPSNAASGRRATTLKPKLTMNVLCGVVGGILFLRGGGFVSIRAAHPLGLEGLPSAPSHAACMNPRANGAPTGIPVLQAKGRDCIEIQGKE
jgi:hypothetical protein